MSAIGVLESVWRYPVKSMAGQELENAYLAFSGVYGDRLFAFTSAASPEAFPLSDRPRAKRDAALPTPLLSSRSGSRTYQSCRG